MALRDFIGKRGESIVSERLLDFCGRDLPYFDPHPLGEKCPIFDYLVELIDAGKSPPYFLASVKATRKGQTKGKARLKVGVKAVDVVAMVKCPVPTYVIGVDEPAGTAYVVSAHGALKGAISSIPTKYPLDGTNLKKLWDEVKTYWATLDPKAKTSSFAF
jgi:hypothetical protein